MPPSVALLSWFVLLIALLYFDPASDRKLSPALWIPLIWLIILGSRLPSQWLSLNVSLSSIQAVEEGNPLDRTVFLVLILLAVGILLLRSFNFSRFVTKHFALVCFLLFALLSIVWSDFPFVTFKRWIRDFGTYLVTLVVLSDRSPLEAMRAVLRRLAYLLVPLSIVLDKYFLPISRQYDPWAGTFTYIGVTTSKNMLGVLCLVCGLYFIWDTAVRWPERRQIRTRRILAVNIAFLCMTIWLLHTARSTTSTICLALGGMVIIVSRSNWIQRRPGVLKMLVLSSFCLYLILNFVFGLNGSMARAVGKDPTLTDRTKIWAFLLGMHTNPFFGTGYQSFWVGSRVQWFWNNSGLGHLNEAHNGYLEIYLELGLIGVTLLIAFLIASFRVISRRLRSSPSLAIFGLAVWLALVFYNMSEAAFETGLLYSVFLMSALAVPERAVHRVGALNAGGKHGAIPASQEAMAMGVAGASRLRQGWRR